MRHNKGLERGGGEHRCWLWDGCREHRFGGGFRRGFWLWGREHGCGFWLWGREYGCRFWLWGRECRLWNG
jgi:hypothetical protein